MAQDSGAESARVAGPFRRMAASSSRAIDFIFGRFALIGAASLMLLLISGYATWHGMSDFILGVSQAGAPAAERLSSPIDGLSVSTETLIIAVVVALTFLMWLALRETFGAGRSWRARSITAPLYIFLALWSVGFGYGFWWSLISGGEATRAGLQGQAEDVRDAAVGVAARLEAVKARLDSVVGLSERQMAREASSGGSCGVASGAGRGPLYRSRESVRDRVDQLKITITETWLGRVDADLKALNAQLSEASLTLNGATIAERQAQFDSAASAIRGQAREIASRSDALGASYASEMRQLASELSIAPGESGFSCYDPALSRLLSDAATEASHPAEVELREAAFNEGAAGVANAVKSLWENVGAYSAALIAWPFSDAEDDVFGATLGGEPITGRDLIALLASLGVDLGLLALTALNPPTYAPSRNDGLAEAHAHLHRPSASVIRHISRAIETAINRAPDASLEWVRLHFLHHGGMSYFVIPNLYSADETEDETQRAHAMNQLAGVLDDLHLILALTPRELKSLGEEEARESLSDLSKYRRAHRERLGEDPAQEGAGYDEPRGVGGFRAKKGKKIHRNHGLLSKAQRALELAGWSPAAQSDVELFRLVDSEGLTPILTVLNEARLTDEPDVDGGPKIHTGVHQGEVVEGPARIAASDAAKQLPGPKGET